MSQGKFPTVLRWASRVVTGILVVGAFAVLLVLTVVPRAVHGSALTVLTGSMTPDIPVGSVVVVRPVDARTLRVGDVVTYQVAPGRAEYVTHRIVAVRESTTPLSFRLKGDANRIADVRPVSSKAIRGKVWFHVPYLGSIRDAVGGGGLPLLGAMLGLAIYAVVQLVQAWRERTTHQRELSPNDDLVAVTLDPNKPVELTPRQLGALLGLAAEELENGALVYRLSRAAAAALVRTNGPTRHTSVDEPEAVQVRA